MRRKITGIPLAPSDEGAVAQATEGEKIPRIAGHENRRRIQNLCREALPLLGEVARSAEGVARVTTRAERKRQSRLN